MNYDEPALVYFLRWREAGLFYVGITTAGLGRRISKHKEGGSRSMKDAFKEHGDPEGIIYRQGLSVDEAKTIEADLIHKVRLVIGDALLNE